MEITTTFTFFFYTIILIDMPTNPTFTMCTHTNRITLLDITKTYSIPILDNIKC